MRIVMGGASAMLAVALVGGVSSCLKFTTSGDLAAVLSSKPTLAFFRDLRLGGPGLVCAKILRQRGATAVTTAVSIRVPALIRLQWRFTAEDGEGDVGSAGLAVCLKRGLSAGRSSSKIMVLRAVCLQW